MINDQNLLTSYRKGEKKAFLSLYNKHAFPLRKFLQGGFSFSSQGRICRFKGIDAGMDVDSIIQETFTRAFIPSTRINYDGTRPFQTYLFSIAKNLVLRECHQRERVVYMENTKETVETSDKTIFGGKDYADNPEQNLQNMELKNITETFINALNQEEQDFFSLRFSEGNTQEKSAEIMNTTRARIKLLENKLDKAMIKYNEAMSIRRTYEQILTRFLDIMRKNGYFIEHKLNPRWKRKNSSGLMEFAHA